MREPKFNNVNSKPSLGLKPSDIAVPNGIKKNYDQKDKLIEKLNEYIKLLEDELNECSGMAYVHGWRSTRIKAGEDIRHEILTIK